MGDMLQSYAWFCAVPKQGTWRSQIFAPHFANIRSFTVAVQQRFYRRFAASTVTFLITLAMTESCRVEVGPLPLLVSGLGGRNQIEVCEVA